MIGKWMIRNSIAVTRLDVKVLSWCKTILDVAIQIPYSEQGQTGYIQRVDKRHTNRKW